MIRAPYIVFGGVEKRPILFIDAAARAAYEHACLSLKRSSETRLTVQKDNLNKRLEACDAAVDALLSPGVPSLFPDIS
jgi:hypothetical protein